MSCSSCGDEIVDGHGVECAKDDCTNQICEVCADADSKMCLECSILEGVDTSDEGDYDDDYDDDDYDDDDYDDYYDDDFASSKCGNCGANIKNDSQECKACGLLFGGAPSGTTGVFGEEDFGPNEHYY